jgi:hypothetical protein
VVFPFSNRLVIVRRNSPNAAPLDGRLHLITTTDSIPRRMKIPQLTHYVMLINFWFRVLLFPAFIVQLLRG